MRMVVLFLFLFASNQAQAYECREVIADTFIENQMAAYKPLVKGRRFWAEACYRPGEDRYAYCDLPSVGRVIHADYFESRPSRRTRAIAPIFCKIEG